MQTYKVSQYWQYAAINFLRIKTFVLEQDIPIADEFDDVNKDNFQYVLIMDKNTPVATARLNLTSLPQLKVERVCVNSSYQKKGVGAKLIHFAENWGKEYGATNVVIASQIQAVPFYEKVGYSVVQDSYEDGLVPTVLLEKKLT